MVTQKPKKVFSEHSIRKVIKFDDLDKFKTLTLKEMKSGHVYGSVHNAEDIKIKQSALRSKEEGDGYIEITFKQNGETFEFTIWKKDINQSTEVKF